MRIYSPSTTTVILVLGIALNSLLGDKDSQKIWAMENSIAQILFHHWTQLWLIDRDPCSIAI